MMISIVDSFKYGALNINIVAPLLKYFLVAIQIDLLYALNVC